MQPYLYCNLHCNLHRICTVFFLSLRCKFDAIVLFFSFIIASHLHRICVAFASHLHRICIAFTSHFHPHLHRICIVICIAFASYFFFITMQIRCICTSFPINGSIAFASHLHLICIGFLYNSMQIRCKFDANINEKEIPQLVHNSMQRRCNSNTSTTHGHGARSSRGLACGTWMCLCVCLFD
jgi:hypothetical protein